MAEDEGTPLVEGERKYGATSWFSGGEEEAEVTASEDTSWLSKLRKTAHENVEGTIDAPLEYVILALIFVNVVLFIISTLPVDSKCFGSKCLRLGDKYDARFELAEAISVIIFTFEYILRIWACIEFPSVAEKGPFWGRIKYATTFFPIIDLISIAPYWISLTIGKESPDFTTALRCFRLVRLLKADKYLNAFDMLADVLHENTTLLVASSFYAMLAWILSSSALYLTERDNPLLGTHFQSIPQAMFPVLLMLTGEYPLADFSPFGQVIAGFIAIVAVAIFAVPSALLASGFIQAVEKSTGRQATVDI